MPVHDLRHMGHQRVVPFDVIDVGFHDTRLRRPRVYPGTKCCTVDVKVSDIFGSDTVTSGARERRLRLRVEHATFASNHEGGS
jgi:hypothetical protein